MVKDFSRAKCIKVSLKLRHGRLESLHNNTQLIINETGAVLWIGKFVDTPANVHHALQKLVYYPKLDYNYVTLCMQRNV